MIIWRKGGSNLVMASTFGLPLGDGALLSGRPLVRFQSDAQMNSQNVDALEIGDTDGSPIEVRIPLIAPDDPNSPVMIPAITTHEMKCKKVITVCTTRFTAFFRISFRNSATRIAHGIWNDHQVNHFIILPDFSYFVFALFHFLPPVLVSYLLNFMALL